MTLVGIFTFNVNSFGEKLVSCDDLKLIFDKCQLPCCIANTILPVPSDSGLKLNCCLSNLVNVSLVSISPTNLPIGKESELLANAEPLAYTDILLYGYADDDNNGVKSI